MLGMEMQARDQNQVQQDGARHATITLDRRAGARAQVSSKSAVTSRIITNDKKAKLSAFERRIDDKRPVPISPPQLETTEAQANLERVMQLSSVLSQYSRVLSKMSLKMVSCPSLPSDSVSRFLNQTVVSTGGSEQEDCLASQV